MPYDPDIPINGDIVDADELRAQFAALHEGTVAANARIDTIPAGPAGPAGSNGEPGPPGNDGAPGAPFAQAVVDAVSTLPPGENATVGVSFDGSNVHFTFGVPSGPTGPEGSQGAPGEVTAQQLSDGLATERTGTARNPSGVGAFGGSFSDPPTQSEMQAFAAYVETLRAALERAP